MNIVHDTTEGRRILAGEITSAREVVVFTGAGVSTESGIPDFRSPGGLWSRMRPIKFQDFLSSEAARLEDWRRRFLLRDEFSGAAPNVAHLAIARLVATGKVTQVITQNIDGLHARAGVPPDRLIELHGNGTFAKCLDCDAPEPLDAVEAAIDGTGRPPPCRACGGVLKCAVVSFGQPMPVDAMRAADAAVRRADLMLAIGSSLQVYPAAGLPVAAKRSGSRLIIVNRDPTDLDGLADVVVRGSIGQLFSGMEHADTAGK